MKNVIAFAISFAFASVAFAGGPSSSLGDAKMDSMSSSSSAASHSMSSTSAEGYQRTVDVGGSSVTRNGDSVSVSHGAQSSHESATSGVAMNSSGNVPRNSSGAIICSHITSTPCGRSMSYSHGTKVSYKSPSKADVQGATKTRCIIKKSGDVEEKVCQFSTISMAEADSYFAKASDGSKSSVR
jgi:hypothetical protein